MSILNVGLRHSIATRLFRVIFGIYIFVAIVVTSLQLWLEYTYTEDQVEIEMQALESTFGPGLTDALWSFNESLLGSILSGMMEIPVVSGVSVLDESGNQVVATGYIWDAQGEITWVEPTVLIEEGTAGKTFDPNYLPNELIHHSFSLVYTDFDGQKSNIGTITVYVDAQVVFDRVWFGFLLTILTAFLKTAVLWGLFLYAVRKLLARPLTQLAQAVEQVDMNNIGAAHIDIGMEDRNEFRVLQNAFNAMLDKLRGAFDEITSLNNDLAKRVDQRTTELQHTQNALSENARRLNAVLDSTYQLIAIARPDGSLLQLNHAAQSMIGVRPEQAEGQLLWKLGPWDKTPILRERIENAVRMAAEGGFSRFESAIMLDDHRELVADLSIGPVKGVNGDVQYVVMEAHDVTPLKRAEEAAQKAREAAEGANKAKSAFLATMSHEIRTPMNGVVGMVDILRESEMSHEQRQITNTIRDSSFSLLHIIDDILDFSKIEAGKLDLEFLPVSLQAVAEGVAETLSSNALAKNVRLLLHVSPDLPEWVMADQVRVRQILFNLVGNAIKFTESSDERRGKVVIQVTRGSTRADGWEMIDFRISDNGIGMTPLTVSQLFQPFSQGESSITRRYGGTGLGLSICSRLTDLMGGTVSVESELNEGSTFTVNIPFKPANEPPVEVGIADLSGQEVTVVWMRDETRIYMRSYLDSWGIKAYFVDNISQLTGNYDKISDKANSNRDIVLVGGHVPPADVQDMRRQLDAAAPERARRYVLINERGTSTEASIVSSDTVILRGDPILPSVLRHGLAIAAGLASPEDSAELQVDRVTDSNIHLLTVEEAEAAGVLTLVVEDNEVNQDVLERQMSLLGVTALMAENGAEALTLLDQHRFGLILTDCHMPTMDGFEMTRRIREKEQESNAARLPIVAITANALQGEAQNCLAAGMDDYLSKPVELQALKKTIEKWMPEVDLDIRSDEMSGQELEPAIVVGTADEPVPMSTEGDAAGIDVEEAKPIDINALAEFMGTDDKVMLKMTVTKFMKLAQTVTAAIETGATEADWKKVRDQAHKLKSSAKTVGAMEISRICADLQQAGEDRQEDDVARLTPQLRTLVDAAQGYFDGPLQSDLAE